MYQYHFLNCMIEDLLTYTFKQLFAAKCV